MMNTERKPTDKPQHPADQGQTQDSTRDPDTQGPHKGGSQGPADKGQPHDTTRDPDPTRQRDNKEQQQPVNDPTGGQRQSRERR
jgi:hypothetical protein